MLFAAAERNILCLTSYIKLIANFEHGELYKVQLLFYQQIVLEYSKKQLQWNLIMKVTTGSEQKRPG